ncbi:hypothetical protein [Streptomyces sp. NPDC014733]|uniref:hypothetical protein n=1 Tax=Streptomyces sp. NPDC014733 TaxID=3364885 RepID=UPI003702329A
MPERDDDPRVGDEEFLPITRDPAMARLLRKQLEVLADGKAGEVMQEMAREVLSGRIGLREAVRVGAYEEELVKHVDTFRGKWDEMSEAERAHAEREGAKFLEEQREEIAREREERTRASREKSRHGGQRGSSF